MFKKVFFILLIFCFVAGSNLMTVSAETPSSYESGFQIRNLSSTDPASINIDFYDLSGVKVLGLTDSVAANSTNTYFPLSDKLVTGFKGSIIISSNQPVVSMSNLVGKNSVNSPISYSSYSAFLSGTSTVSVPLLMKNNYGYNTNLTVQNTGSIATDVTVQYSDGTSKSKLGLAPGASVTFDQATETHTKTVFSATVTSTESVPLAAVVIEVGPDTLFAYGGFGAGSTNPVMPLINENNYGYFTGVQIQNQGSQSTQVTVAYTPAPGMPGTACTEVRTIAANSSTIFAQNVFTSSTDSATLISTTCKRGETFVGSGKVTSNSNSQPLVSVVNQLNSLAKKGAAYMGFSPEAGKSKVVMPLIMDRNYGYFTSWSLVNVGTSSISAGEISCLVTGTDKSGTSVTKTFTSPQLAVGGSWTLNHLNVISDGFVGGATCTGPVDSKLVGSVNQLANSSIDSFLVYEGFSVDP